MSSCADIRSLRRCSNSAALMVGSSSMSTSPALTVCPSCTRIARTTPVSNGWMTLLRPVGTILPGATATMSTVPSTVHASATQKTATIVAATARPIGEGGVSTTSSAAGRKAASCRARRDRGSGKRTTFGASADILDSGLQIMKLGIAAAGANQLDVSAVLCDPPALQGYDAIDPANRRKPMRNDEDRPSFDDAFHVVLDDPLALVVEGACGLVEDQDARLRDQRARSRCVAAGCPTGCCPSRRRSCRSLRAAPG